MCKLGCIFLSISASFSYTFEFWIYGQDFQKFNYDIGHLVRLLGREMASNCLIFQRFWFFFFQFFQFFVLIFQSRASSWTKLTQFWHIMKWNEKLCQNLFIILYFSVTNLLPNIYNWHKIIFGKSSNNHECILNIMEFFLCTIGIVQQRGTSLKSTCFYWLWISP